jgi:hypothetical protein
LTNKTPLISEYPTTLEEELADTVHHVWSDFIHDLEQCVVKDPESGYRIPSAVWTVWLRQASTDYTRLSESERDRARADAARFTRVIKNHRAKNGEANG